MSDISFIFDAVRFLIAGMFILSGITKFFDLSGSRKTMIDFGVPTKVANIFGPVLPIVEIIIAFLLVLYVSALWGSIFALVLLSIFTAGISANLLLGRNPECHCFGQISTNRISSKTLVRNGLLLSLTITIILQLSGFLNSVTDMIYNIIFFHSVEFAFFLTAVVIAIVEGYYLFVFNKQEKNLHQQIKTLESKLNEVLNIQTKNQNSSVVNNKKLPTNTIAPSFGLQGIDGKIQTLSSLLGLGKPLILIFVDPNCGPCSSLLPKIANWQKDNKDVLTISIISRGSLQSNVVNFTRHGLSNILIQNDREVDSLYGVTGTPSAIYIHKDGKISSNIAIGANEISSLVIHIAKTFSQNMIGDYHHSFENNLSSSPSSYSYNAFKIGNMVPSFRLPAPDGKIVDIADFRGKEILIIFWSNNCLYCNQILEHIRILESKNVSARKDTPIILIVLISERDYDHLKGLWSKVVLDQNFEFGTSLGVEGIPSALIIDKESKISSHLSAGPSAVIALVKSLENSNVNNDKLIPMMSAYQGNTDLRNKEVDRT